jgi:hypothetical protein
VNQEKGRRELAGQVRRLLRDGEPGSDVEVPLVELFARNVADDVDTLRRLAVLEEHDPDSWSYEPEPLPAGDERAWAEAVERMRRTPKSSVLPPTRLHAPLESS